MTDDATDLGMLHPRAALETNASPLQTGATDTLLRTSSIGGPEQPGDRRIYLGRKLLAKLANVAADSTMQRVQIDRAGVRVDLYQQPDGHTYEVWTLIGGNPRPEPLPNGLAGLPGLVGR